jgi:IMP dehydrogenase
MADRFKGLALTFDDILLEPRYSNVTPVSVKVTTQLTKKIKINIPIISAAMDTVTESSMAIALARLGGLGVIHRNFSVEDQAAEVRRVKRSESEVIDEPLTISPEATLEEAKNLIEENDVSGILVVNNHRLKGILTQRDLWFEENLTKKVKDVMTKENLVTAKVGTSQEEAEKIIKKYKIEKLPLINKNGVLKGLITWKDLNKRRLFPNACKDEKGRLRVAAAVGASEEMPARAAALVGEGVDILVVDKAHGHHENVLRAVAFLKKAFPKVEVVAGNIATAEADIDLIKKGADAVKVGVGSGSICTTRDVAGVGVPQFSAILECAKVAKRLKVPVIADGGIVYPADLVKSLAAGASCVMLGNMLAGTDEAPGDIIITSEGRRYKKYRGMGSFEAMKARSYDRYFQKEVPEGISGKVPYKGAVSKVVKKLVESLKTAMSYYGAREIDDLQNVTFRQITSAGLRESHPHTVMIEPEEETFS